MKRILSGILVGVMLVYMTMLNVLATDMTEYSVLDTKAVRLLGRGEVSEDGSRTFNWSNAGFEFEFTGSEAYVNVTKSVGISYFNVSVDNGEPKRVLINNTGWVKICSGLTNSKHIIMFVRSSAGTRGAVKFDKVKTDGTAKATEEKIRKIEFIGDSYTTGYGNIATNETWEAPTATDSWYSYAGYAARELSADYTLIAYAGRGVIKGYSGTTAHEMPYQFGLQEICCDWDAATNMSTGKLQDYSEYQPQLVVIWLGTNDQANGVSASSFEAGYIGLLENVRSAYPDASVLCLSKTNAGYPENIKNAIAHMGGKDEGFYYEALTTYSGSSMGHPSKAEAGVIGKELAGYIEKLNVLPEEENEEEPVIRVEEVLYENDFNAGASDLTYENYETYDAGFRADECVNVSFPKFGGNPGLATGRKTPGRTFIVDFTKSLSMPGEGGAGKTAGKIKVSLDFVMQKVGIINGERNENTATIGTRLNNFYDGNIMAEFGNTVLENGTTTGRFVARQNAEQWCTLDETKVTKYISLDELHTFDMVINMDAAYTVSTYYIDGVKIDTTTTFWQNNLPNIMLCFNTFFKYIDNVKVSYVKEGTFYVEDASVPQAGEKYIDIYTSEMPGAITADMVTVNGKVVESVEVFTNPGAYKNSQRYAIRANLKEAVVEGENYEVKIAENAKNFLGTVINGEKTNILVKALGKSTLTMDNGILTARIVNGDDTPIKPVLMVVEYAEDGRFKSVSVYNKYNLCGKEEDSIPGETEATITVDVDSFEGDVKAFLVDGMKTLVPLV